MEVIPFLFLPAVALVMALYAYSKTKRSRRVLAEWADNNGLSIVQAHLCLIGGGPFFLARAGGSAVFRVDVVGRDGVRRKGFVLCDADYGSFEVRWDEGE